MALQIGKRAFSFLLWPNCKKISPHFLILTINLISNFNVRDNKLLSRAIAYEGRLVHLLLCVCSAYELNVSGLGK